MEDTLRSPCNVQAWVKTEGRILLVSTFDVSKTRAGGGGDHGGKRGKDAELNRAQGVGIFERQFFTRCDGYVRARSLGIFGWTVLNVSYAAWVTKLIPYYKILQKIKI